MDDTQKAALASMFRTLLAVAGGALATHGLVNDAQWAQISGALITLAPLVWGAWQKYRAEANTQVRVAAAYNAGATNMPSPDKPNTDPPKGATP